MREIPLIAHRGASHEAPENTLAAFRLAWEAGADGVEGDFRLTRDGEIVCLHDPTTRRTAGASLTVADSSLSQLRKLDVGSWKGVQWSREPIPTLREIIDILPPGKSLFMELKSGPEILIPLAAILAEAMLPPEQTVILAFSEEIVSAARRLLPHVKALWITDYHRKRHSGEWSPSCSTILRTLEQTGASGLASQAHHSIDAPFVHALRTAGMEFHVWTIDVPGVATRFLSMGADSITTNRPGWLRARLQALTPGS